MNQPVYYVAPAARSFNPGLRFKDLDQAREAVQQFARRYRAVYCLWRFENGRLRLLARAEAGPVRA